MRRLLSLLASILLIVCGCTKIETLGRRPTLEESEQHLNFVEPPDFPPRSAGVIRYQFPPSPAYNFAELLPSDETVVVPRRAPGDKPVE